MGAGVKRGGPLKRTEFKRKKELPRRTSTLAPKTPLAKGRRAKKWKQTEALFDVGREFWQERRTQLWARANGRCEVGGCDLASTGMEAHHRHLRSQGGKHGLENLMALCPACHHDRVHAHPTWAKEKGYIVPQVAGRHDPASYAVQLWDGRTVRLTETGGYDTVFPAPPNPEENP